MKQYTKLLITSQKVHCPLFDNNEYVVPLFKPPFFTPKEFSTEPFFVVPDRSISNLFAYR